MITNLRLVHAISHLSYSSKTVQLIPKFQQLPTPSTFKLLNFQNVAEAPPLHKRFFKVKQHAQLLQLYLNFMKLGESHPKQIAYTCIQQNLRNTILTQLNKTNIKITVQKFKFLESQLIEQNQFHGVFVHRRLNLNSDSYDINANKNGSVSFNLKKSLRFEAVKEYEKIMRLYDAQKMEDIYCKDFDTFQKQKEIKRYIFRVLTDLVVTIEQNGHRKTLGNNGPTEHMLQVQSVFNRYYNLEEYFLTDVDFILKGNYFLRNKFY